MVWIHPAPNNLVRIKFRQLSDAPCAAFFKSIFAIRATLKPKLIAIVVCWMSLEPSAQVMDEIDAGFNNTKKDISTRLLKRL